MSDMTPEEQAERIRRLQARRGTAADAPEVRRSRRRKHGMKTRLALSALTLASFGSLVGAMAVGQGSGTASVASATKTTAAPATGDDESTTSSAATAATGTSSTSASNTSSATSGTSSKASTRQAVTSTKAS